MGGRETSFYRCPSSLPSKTLQGLETDCYPKRIFSGSLTGRLRPFSVYDKLKLELVGLSVSDSELFREIVLDPDC